MCSLVVVAQQPHKAVDSLGVTWRVYRKAVQQQPRARTRPLSDHTVKITSSLTELPESKRERDAITRHIDSEAVRTTGIGVVAIGNSNQKRLIFELGVKAYLLLGNDLNKLFQVSECQYASLNQVSYNISIRQQ